MNRRESLALLAGAAATLTGCSGFASGSGDSSSATAGAERTVTEGPQSGTATAPETFLVRVGTDRPPVRLADTNGDGGGRPTPRREDRYIGSIVVDGQSRADRLSIAEPVDEAGFESFLESTDFGAETVYIETISVEECFRLELCRISWRPDDVSTDYARRGRPYDEQCAVDEQVFEARLVRLPDAIDADRVRGGSTSIGTGACDRGRHRAEAVGEAGSGSATSGNGESAIPTGTNTATGGEQ